MDINLRGDQSNANLNFTWKAFFDDGLIIEQFENGIEHKFKEVQDNSNKLIRFSLVNKDYSQYFTVDLQTGFIIYNNCKNIEAEKKENIRLIYFLRHRVTLTELGKEIEHTIEYHLGLQWVTINNENRKIIFQISKNGSWILGDN